MCVAWKTPQGEIYIPDKQGAAMQIRLRPGSMTEKKGAMQQRHFYATITQYIELIFLSEMYAKEGKKCKERHLSN